MVHPRLTRRADELGEAFKLFVDNFDLGDFIQATGGLFKTKTGEITLRVPKRNVLGFAMDFAEDRTKSTWSFEGTWIEGVPFEDNDERDGTTTVDTFNLTVSVDRPTFINFLNPNRTFFINSQWFFSYLPDHRDSFTFNGPVNVLFTGHMRPMSLV